MTNSFHRHLPPEDIHHPHSYIFSTNEDRLNYVHVTSEDIGKLALVLSDFTLWMLTNVDPIVWKAILMDNDGTRPVGPALGDLQGQYPYPSVIPDSHHHTPGVSIPAYPTSLPPTGPAGGHLVGNYPNPTLSHTGVVGGIYNNPTLTIDSTGRITQALSNEKGETNVGVNLGPGQPIYSHKQNSDLFFRTLVAQPDSGLSLSVSDTLDIDTPGLAKLAGADFIGPVTTIDLESENLEAKSIYSPLYDAGEGNTWVPDARDGMVQRRRVGGGTLLLDSILFAKPGMQITLFLYQADQILSGVTFASSYKFGVGASKSLSQKAYTTDVIKITVMSPSFYFTEIVRDLG